jgi:hypothetical protein
MRTTATFNLSKTIDGVRAIRIKYDSHWQEHRVELVLEDGTVDHESTYHTDTKKDAYDTAQWIVNDMEKRA